MAENTGMKLEVNSPMSETTITNSMGLERKGKSKNPAVSATSAARIIHCPFPVLSSSPPQNGENSIVSGAGINDTSEIIVYDAPSE